jgi:hypothetical protein
VISPKPLAKLLKTPRIIWATLTGGLLAFGLAAGKIVAIKPPPSPNSANAMLLVCAVLAASCLLLYPLLRAALMRSIQRQWEAAPGQDDPATDLFPRWMTIWLIGAAMTEAVALFAIVIFIVTGHMLAMACAAAGWLVLAAQVPRESSVRRFVQNTTGQTW